MKHLKKIIAVMLVGILALTFDACGQGGSKPAETPAPATEAPATEAPATQAPETAAPETAAPETAAPETAAPETQAAPVADGTVYEFEISTT